MKMKDLKSGTQLRIGLGAIPAFVSLLGAMASFQVLRSRHHRTQGGKKCSGKGP
jgi:hypothetical protein